MLESVRLSSVGVRTMEAAIRSCAARISSILTGSADASAGIVFCWFICVTLYDRKRDISTAIRSGVGRKQALCRPDGKNRIYRPWNNGTTHGGASCQGGARQLGRAWGGGRVVSYGKIEGGPGSLQK